MIMSTANTDDAKGRLKEAAGAITNDKDLKNEGKADQAGARAKEVTENVKDAVNDGVDKVKDAFTRDKT
jgi:uncharacterized protein YjbJ (UPF0337 family)